MNRIILTLAGLLLLFANQATAQSCANEETPSKVPLGANLEGITDYALSNTFVDMVKQSRGFYMSCDGCAFGTPVGLDANGWPTANFEVIFQSFFDGTAATYSGTYKLSFNGTATIGGCCVNHTITNIVYDAATNTTTADVNVQATEPAGGAYLILNFRNTRRVAGGMLNSGLTNLKLIRPGYPANTTQTFTNAFLDHIERFDVLRFMDWANTNNSNVVAWNDRTSPTNPSQSGSQTPSKGVAWEYCIELANLTGKDMWVNVPHQADDNYVSQLATLIRDNLNPSLNVYVEYSNEVWNFQFQQYGWNMNAADAEVDTGTSNLNNDGETNPTTLGARRIARRLKEISDIFGTVWGAASINTRVRPVFCYQLAWSQAWLNPAIDWMNATYGNPSNYFYAIAGAPYFHVADDAAGLTSEQILDRLESEMNDLFALTNDHTLYFDVAVASARYYGLKFLCYEGGPDTFGPNNILAKIQASLDPRMEEITENFLNKWYSYGLSGLFNWFTAGATNWNGNFGTWGLTYNMDDQNTPKIRGIDNVLNGPLPEVTAGFELSATAGTEIDARQYVLNRYYNSYPYNWETLNPYNRYLDGGTSNDYLIRVTEPGRYNLTVDYACWINGVNLRVLLNNQVIQTIPMPRTGNQGQEIFQASVPVQLNLSEGLNVVRLYYEFSGRAYDIRSLEFNYVGPCTALPVELLSFDASLRRGGQVELGWTTANEMNNDYFLVEKSSDGISFEPMKIIPSQKLTASNYKATDESPFIGITYYRLKQVDYNGDYTYSDVRTVELKPFDITLMYPVPAYDNVSFEFHSSEEKEIWISLIDGTGKKLLTKNVAIKKGVSTLQLHLPSLPSAMYFLQVYDEDGKNQVAKEFFVNGN